MGSKVNLGSLGILKKRAFVSFQRHTVLVLIFTYHHSNSGFLLMTINFAVVLNVRSHSNLNFAHHFVTLPATAQGFIFYQFRLLTLPAQRGRVLYCNEFFLSFCQHCQYLRDPMSDDAHTWSQYQVCERALLTWPVWGQRSRRGHRGQKGHFHQKCYFSFRLHRYGHGTHVYWSARYPLQKLSD